MNLIFILAVVDTNSTIMNDKVPITATRDAITTTRSLWNFYTQNTNNCSVNGANNLKHILAQLGKGSAISCLQTAIDDDSEQ